MVTARYFVTLNNIRGVQFQTHASPQSVSRSCFTLDLIYCYIIFILPSCVMILSSVLSNMSDDIVTLHGRQGPWTLNYL